MHPCMCSFPSRKRLRRGAAGERERLRRLQHHPALVHPRRGCRRRHPRRHGLPLLHQRRRRALPHRPTTRRLRPVASTTDAAVVVLSTIATSSTTEAAVAILSTIATSSTTEAAVVVLSTMATSCSFQFRGGRFVDFLSIIDCAHAKDEPQDLRTVNVVRRSLESGCSGGMPCCRLNYSSRQIRSADESMRS